MISISSSSRSKTLQSLVPSVTKHALSSTPTAQAIVELRQYALHPSSTAHYTQQTIASSPHRKSLPLKFFGFPETGAIPLNTAVHLYHYKSHADRLQMRAELAKKQEWQDYLGNVKECMKEQQSEIFVEAPLIKEFDEVSGLSALQDNSTSGVGSTKSIIEFRKYQLQLGYETVPNLLQLYSSALPSKLATIHPTTQLISLLVSDITSLNTVYEIWKHGDTMTCGMSAMEESRVRSRDALEWRRGIGEIAKLSVRFESSVLRPVVFSPLQ
ncbi:hypothetical protein ACHAXN_009745 [Cyclotella atomus]